MPDIRQLPLELRLEPRFGEEDFLVSRSNADAYALIEAWPDWPSRMLALAGPAASGKSHLAAIWASRSGASQISARALGVADLPALVSAGSVAVEDIDRKGVSEAVLFHLINLAAEKGAHLLLTMAAPPSGLKLQTRDLVSRLRKAPLAEIAAPDDALIRALLVKLFVDRQLVVDTALVEYLTTRLERSFGAVRAAVEALDRGTLARGRRLTRQVAGQILGWKPDG